MRALLWALAGCSGCAPLAAQALGAAAGNTNPLAPFISPGGRYVSGAPVGTTGVKIRVLSFRSDFPLEISLSTPRELTANLPQALRRAFVAPPAAPPCTAGWMAESIWLGGQQRWDRPLFLADELDLAFPLPREYLRDPLVLDLVVEDATGSHCTRIPLGSPDERGMTRESRTSGGGGFGLILGRPGRTDGGTASSGVPYGVVVMASLGRWVNLWRLGGRIEACFGSCAAAYIVTVPAAAMVERLLYRGRSLTVAASLGYQLGRIEDVTNVLEGKATWAHGPRVGLSFLGPRPFAGADPGEGFAARGIEISLLRQFFSVGAASIEPPTWILGLAVVAL